MEHNKRIERRSKIAYCFYGIFLFFCWGLMFFVQKEHYTRNDIIEGMSFIGVVISIYFLLGYLYNKSEFGKRIVMLILLLLFIIACIGFYFSV